MTSLSFDRRKFMKVSGATTAALTVMPTIMANNTEAVSQTLNIGIVGLGGRGSGAVVNALRADKNVKLIAVAEFFRDRLDKNLANLEKSLEKQGMADKISVPEEYKFTGFDGYKKLLELDVDVVILTTPPHFRPMHAEAAIKAGKHVFAEKPLATDATGLRLMKKVVGEAKKKKLSFLVGFMNRFDKSIVTTFNKVLKEGVIGDVTNVQANYNTGGVWHRGNDEKWTQMDYQMRNWYYFNWLCGDQLVEQCVHNTDKLTWIMGDKPPISCLGFGGRQQRVEEKYGNIWDHCSISYEYENNVFGNVNCRHQKGCDNSISDMIRGTKGFVNLNQRRIYDNKGEPIWRYNSKTGNKNSFDYEHVKLFEGIRSGNVINNGDYSVISTGVAIMGRMSAYTGRRIYWDHAEKPSLMQSKEDLSPSEYKLGDIEMRPIPVPGRTKYI